MLSLAADSFDAERDHVERNTRTMLERTTESLETQLSERLESLENFLSAQREGQEEEEYPQLRRSQEVLEDLTNAVRIHCA